MTKFPLILILLSSPFTGFSQNIDKAPIRWPAGYDPSKARFYVYNEITIEASPETIWPILINALAWPDWYKGAKDVSFKTSDRKALEKDSSFFWKTMGLRFESMVREFEPMKVLAWESKKKSIQGYHVWYLIPTETGTRVVTAEAQNGWLASIEKIFQPKKLRKLHDIWLQELKKLAEKPISGLKS